MSIAHSSQQFTPDLWQNIPQELKTLPQWAVADLNKKPRTPTEGLPYAKVNDPSTWRDFETACHYARLYNMQIGFMLSANDPYLIIDLDVKEDTPQEVIDGYHSLIQKFDCYTEHSVSVKGFHIVAHGNIGAGKRREGIEVYSQDRFMIFTGNVVNDKPIKKQPELLAQLLNTLDHTQSTGIELNALDFESDDPQGRTAADIAQIVTSSQDELGRLFRGDWQGRQYPSQSEADLALITELGLITPSNKVCLEVFRMSALGQRPKANRKDYILRTFRIAREQVYHSQNGERIADAMFAKWEKDKQAQHQVENSSSFGVHAGKVPINIFNTPLPKPFQLDEVPPIIAELANDYSLATGIDSSGIIVAAVVAATAVIDDRIQLQVDAKSNWSVSARLWGFLCGKSSAGKSPCIRAVTAPIKEMHNSFYDQCMEKTDHPTQTQPLRELYTSDATIAAMSELLKDNPAGILMLNEEISSWLGAIDCGSQGDALKNRGDWLQLRDGGHRQINRVARGRVHVKNWGASVLAACTPSGLRSQMKNTPEDGLIQRFIPCLIRSKNIDITSSAESALQGWDEKIQTVYALTSKPPFPTIQWSAEAYDLFNTERRRLQQQVQDVEDLHPSFASHLGKHAGMVAEVALTFHYFSDEAVPSGEISVDTLALAIKFMRRVAQHSYYLYSGILSSSSALELAQALARSIIAEKESIETIGRDFMTQHCSLFRKADDRLRREAIQMLEDMDWIKADPNVKGYGGWPKKFDVNPRVFELYGYEGAEWRKRREAVLAMIKDIDDMEDAL